MKMKKLTTICLAAVILSVSGMAQAGFTPFVIRGSNSSANLPIINDLGGGQTQFLITEGGMKAALGTNDVNGYTVGDIASASIDRVAIDPPGSYAPYMNIWVTDGSNYAVIANEPSNVGEWPPGTAYDTTWVVLQNATAKAYENSDKSWLPNGGTGLTFSDVAGLTIQAPSVAELTAGWAGLGSGAPRELGTNVAYGFNWVFGDTMTNYVSGDDGFIVANPSIVPEPGTICLLGLGGLVFRRRRKA